MTEAQWAIRLECTVCGQRKRRCRSDGEPPFGSKPQATTTVVCDQCNADAGYPDPEIKTLHFVDYATDAELGFHLSEAAKRQGEQDVD